ncbi:uncharacterized protein DS421_17g590000 [Arachis hypogaea]|nr:uncharacterized protein DS421_17g590000 [Arachis hypogaea]
MARKGIHARTSSRQEAASSKRNAKGKEQVPEEEEVSPLPSPQPSPPRRSTPHPSSRSQRTKKPILHDTREPSNLDSLDFKNKFDEGARAYISGKWDNHVGVSLQVALTRVCENFSALDGTTLTHKALGPVRALLHRIINHILMPQSGSYQRVIVCDTLALFAILNFASISFACLMVRHMWDCVRSDKKANLPYRMFLTCIFEYFNVDISNEPVENRVSTIKGGGVPDSIKGKKGKSSMASMISDSESDSLPPESSKTYKEARKQAYENEKAWTKYRERINLLIKSLETTSKDKAHSEGEHDYLDFDENVSDA